MEEQNKILIYSDNDGLTRIDVVLEDETLWLTQAQMCELYQTSKSNVSEHIKHIFEDGAAENAGGLKMIKAMAAPYTMMKFMPTGGISTSNVRDYLMCDKILACGGSWMVKGDLINAGNFAEIEKLTKEAAEIVKEIRD